MTLPEPSSPPPNAPLDYAALPPWHRRRHGVRLIVLLAAVIAIGVGVFVFRRYQPVVAQHLAVVDLHQTCLSYAIPPQTVVYEELSEPVNFASPASSTTVAAALPQDMIWMAVKGGTWRWLAPPFLRNQRLMGMPATPGLSQWGILFLHARAAPGGPQRLVCVEVNHGRLRLESRASSASDQPTFHARVIRPASLLSSAALLWEKDDPIEGWDYPPFSIQIYGGQIDPNDSSRFTIAFRRSSASPTCTIDGRLGADDTVRLKVRPTGGNDQ